MAGAKKLAGLKPDTDVEIEILPQPKSFFEQLFSGEGVDSSEFTAALSDVGGLSDVVKTLRQAAAWRRLLSGKVQLWMPYHVELK